jgi:hypothetical protein
MGNLESGVTASLSPAITHLLNFSQKSFTSVSKIDVCPQARIKNRGEQQQSKVHG